MSNFKPGNPGCSCCDPPCDELCFHAVACGHNYAGVEIRVFATATPGTILASGTTDASGNICFDLAAYAATSLSFRAIPPDLDDYGELTNVLLGNWCGRTVEVDIPPATIPGTPAESSGTINVLLTRCDGTTPWSGQTVEIKVLLTVVASGTTDANGRVAFTVTADGSSAYYVRSYTTSPTGNLNSATFTLAAGQCADVHMRMTHTGLPCNPDTEAVIVKRTCSTSTPDTPKRCCEHCFPDTLPSVLRVYDVDALGMINTGGGWSVSGTCDAVPIYYNPLGLYWAANGGAASECFHDFDLGGGIIYRQFARFQMTCKPDAYGNPWIYLKMGAESYKTAAPGEGLCYHELEVPASSITCDPFAATFDFSSLPMAFIPCTGRDGLFPSQTLTVTE
jgi:hypothetical protein